MMDKVEDDGDEKYKPRKPTVSQTLGLILWELGATDGLA
jgi:hypothetical protein